MPKLATPVQYEPTLEGLNDIRPLQLADESKIVVPYPALCQNPPTKDRPAVGKLARCSEQGALLKSLPKWADKIYADAFALSDGVSIIEYIFSIKVFGIIAMLRIDIGSPEGYWCSYDGEYSYIRLIENTYIFLPFVGTNIWFVGLGTPPFQLAIFIKGFYK